MGMYTCIRHPVTGQEIQIKTGDDHCDWFSVGEKTDAPSGVYSGTRGERDSQGYWISDLSVIIYRGRFAAVIELPEHDQRFRFVCECLERQTTATLEPEFFYEIKIRPV